MDLKFNRLMRLTGEGGLTYLEDSKVIVFGVGGVGSWCCESLIRSGIGHLTIVDSDLVCITNINRQLQATTKSVGQVKVNSLRSRLLDINPDAEIIAIEKLYSVETQNDFNLDDYDYVIDAIDSLSCKIELIDHALSSNTTLFSSFGAASKLDPTKVQIEQIWKTHGCPLGRLVRNRLKKRGIKKKFLCVFSDEVVPGFEVPNVDSLDCDCPKREGCGEVYVEYSQKKQINGSITHITGVFGFMLAGLVVQDILKK